MNASHNVACTVARWRMSTYLGVLWQEGSFFRKICWKYLSIIRRVYVRSSSLASSAGANISFRCASDAGALLINGPAAYSREIKTRKHIETYMREHFPSWVEFSDHLGLDLRDEDLYFVYGTTKTSQWAVTAFKGDYKQKSGTISATLGSVAGAGAELSFSISNQTMPSCWHRVRPNHRRDTTPILRNRSASLPASSMFLMLLNPKSVSPRTPSKYSCTPGTR